MTNNIPEAKYRLRHYAMASIENYCEVYKIINGGSISPTSNQVELDEYVLRFDINSLNDTEVKVLYKLIFGES